MKRWIVLLLCATACGGDLASPVSAVAVTWDISKQSFKLAQVRLNTLTSVRHLQGTSGDVTAGGTVRTSRAAASAKGATVASLQAAFVSAPPGQVQLAYSLLNDIVYPENYDSLFLLSAYYNFEKVRGILGGWGYGKVPPRPLVANADVKDENGLWPMPDGELYFAPLATFYLPPATAQSGLPAALNLGAVAHALGHEAVEEQLWGGAPLPPVESGGSGDPNLITARHAVRSFTEGVSDFLGVAVSGDPGWFQHSVPQRAASRSLDQLRCSTPDMLQALAVDDSVVPYDPYPLGTVLAGALWDASQNGVQGQAQAVQAALPELAKKAAVNNGQLTLATMLDVLAANAPTDQQAQLCGILLNRFAKMSITSLPSCGTTQPQMDCQ